LLSLLSRQSQVFYPTITQKLYSGFWCSVLSAISYESSLTVIDKILSVQRAVSTSEATPSIMRKIRSEMNAALVDDAAAANAEFVGEPQETIRLRMHRMNGRLTPAVYILNLRVAVVRSSENNS
jgi:hypothetical protein